MVEREPDHCFQATAGRPSGLTGDHLFPIRFALCLSGDTRRG